MKRFILPCLLITSLLLPACREQSKEQILQQGIEFAKNDNPQAAITLFKEALEKDPNFMDARLQLGNTYFAIGKYDFAEKELEKVQRQDPMNHDISLRLAQIYLKTDRGEKAFNTLVSLESSLPNNTEVLSTLALCYALKGDLVSSESKLRKALLVNPKDLNARLGLVRVLAATNRSDAGKELLETVITDNPNDTAPYYLKLQLSMLKADREGAINSLRSIRVIKSDDFVAAFMLGLLYLDADNIDACRKVVSEIKTMNPEHPLAYRLDGMVNYQQGNYQQAINSLQKSLTKMPDQQGYYFAGVSYYQLKQYEQALSSFQKAIDSNPNNEQSRLMLAQTFLKQGRVDDCIRTANALLVKNPRSAVAYNVLGSAYLTLGKYDQAMKHLDKALELDPDLAQAHLKKGLFNLSTGNLKTGEVDLQNAVAAAPEVLNNRMLLANHYLRTKNYPLALKTMQQGLTNSPDSAILYNNMSAVHFAQKNTAEALASLEKAKKLKPDYLSPYFNLANYYVSRQDYPAAIKEYQQALAAVPNNLTSILKLAGLYELSGDKDQAELHYKQASTTGDPAGYMAYAAYLSRIGQKDNSLEVLKSGSAAHPDNPNLTRALGVIYQVNGQSDAAIKMFTHLEKIAPGNGSPLLIAVYLQNDNVTAANEIARQVIAEHPDTEYGYLLQTAIYEHRKEWAAAEDNLKRGITACKQDLNLKMKLASVYAAQKKTAQALQIYDEVLFVQPKFAPALFAKGAIYDSQGNKAKAQELYKATLELEEDFAPALNNLAYLQMEVYGNYKEALQLAIRAFRKLPEDPSVIDTLGYALLKNGQAVKAVAFFEKAARLRPNDAAIQSHLEQAKKAAKQS